MPTISPNQSREPRINSIINSQKKNYMLFEENNILFSDMNLTQNKVSLKPISRDSPTKLTEPIL